MAYRNTFFRWLFLYSLTFGLTYVLKLFTYLCPETGQTCQEIGQGKMFGHCVHYKGTNFKKCPCLWVQYNL